MANTPGATEEPVGSSQMRMVAALSTRFSALGMPSKRTSLPCDEPRDDDSVVHKRSKPPTMLPTKAAEAVIAAADRFQELTALVDFDCDALLQAAADLERTPAAKRGPLHGVPIGVKDNIDVAGHATTAGCPAMPRRPPRFDAPVVRRLRTAGALIAAKTAMHELGLGVTSVNSWSGPVRNPHDADLVAGGSSGGSAAAVAAGILPVALGTDTGGSIRIPAALCGVVGFRPTIGRWPLDGVVPISRTRDVVGPIASTVSMCALADEVVCGLPPREPSYGRISVGMPQALWTYVDPGVRTDCLSLVTRAPRELLQLVEVQLPIDLENLLEYGLTIAQAETLDSIGGYHREAGHVFDPRSFASGVKDPEVRAIIRELTAGGGPDIDTYEAALRSRKADQETLSGWLNDKQIDLLCFPAVATAAVPVGRSQTIEFGDEVVSVFDVYTRQPALASVLGLPAITIPANRNTTRMPVGLEIVGHAGNDRSLLSWAERIEALTDATATKENDYD